MSENEINVIQSMQLNILLKVYFRTLVTSTLLLMLVALVQSAVVDTKLLVPWLALSLLVNFIRIYVCKYWQQYPANNSDVVNARLNLFRVGVALSGALWTMDSFFVFNHNRPDQELFYIYTLAGLSSGAVVSYSIDRISALAYIVTGLPVLLNMLTQGNSVYLAMSLSGFFYVVFMMYSVFQFNAGLIEGIRLRYQADLRESEMKKLAFNDVLTGLPNRRMFQERLERAISMSKRVGYGGALLFIDIDHFKALNDSHGHDVGDMLLKQVAHRLRISMRETDTVSRFGGDEFVVMIENLSKEVREVEAETEKITRYLMSVLCKPYQLDKFEHNITVSIGVAVFDKHGQNHDELLKNADVAMYQAKRAGRNAAVVYNGQMAPA